MGFYFQRNAENDSGGRRAGVEFYDSICCGDRTFPAFWGNSKVLVSNFYTPLSTLVDTHRSTLNTQHAWLENSISTTWLIWHGLAVDQSAHSTVAQNSKSDFVPTYPIFVFGPTGKFMHWSSQKSYIIVSEAVHVQTKRHQRYIEKKKGKHAQNQTQTQNQTETDNLVNSEQSKSKACMRVYMARQAQHCTGKAKVSSKNSKVV